MRKRRGRFTTSDLAVHLVVGAIVIMAAILVGGLLSGLIYR